MEEEKEKDLRQRHVYISYESHRAMRIQAAMEGRTMFDLVSMVILDYVNANKERHQQP